MAVVDGFRVLRGHLTLGKTDPGTASGGADSRQALAILTAALVLAVIAYAPHLSNGFTIDDHAQIEGNPYLSGSLPFGYPLTNDVWAHMAGEIGDFRAYYRPGIYLFYRLVLLVGDSSAVFHAASLTLHLAVVLLAFMVSRALGAGARTSAVASAVVALHPMAAETAFSAADASDQLVAIGLLAALAATIRARSTTGWARAAWLVLAGVATAVGLLSKETAVVIAPVLTLESFRAGPHRWRQHLPLAGPWLLTGAWAALRQAVVGGGATGALFPDLGWSLGRTGLALAWYARHLVLPWPLTPVHPFPVHPGDPPGNAVGIAVLAAVALVVGWAARRRQARFFTAWFLFPFLPSLVHFFVAQQVVSGVVVAERYAYVSLAPFGFFVAGLGASLWRRSGSAGVRSLMAFAGCAAAVASCAAVSSYGPAFRDDASYFRQAARYNPASAYVLNGLGLERMRAGDLAGAVELFRSAVRSEPRAAQWRISLGEALVRSGRGAEAIEPLREALRIGDSFSSAHTLLAGALRDAGRLDEAGVHYRRAVELRPGNAGARVDYGTYLFMTGREDAALREWEAAIRLDPGLPEALFNAARVYSGRGEIAHSRQLFRRFLAVAPASLSDARREAEDALAR